VTLGKVTDRAVGLLIDPRNDELGQRLTGLVEHAERAVAGVDQLAGGIDDALQRRGEVQVGPDRHRGIDQLTQPRAPGDRPPGHHPMLRRGQDLRPSPASGTTWMLDS
jgi:hypothetical protein